MPRQEPVRPIDPGAWVAHTAAVRGKSQCLSVLANFPCMAGESKSFIQSFTSIQGLWLIETYF